MASYVFRAIDLAGVPARGEVTAESRESVVEQLKARGLVVLDVADKHSSRELNITLFERVKAQDLTVMTRQLATMIASGVTILRTLYVLEEQTQCKPLKEALIEVRKSVEGGSSFSEALRAHPKIFNPLYIAIVESGETGGLLEESLLRIADQLEKDDSLRRRVKAAMIYPAVVISFALIVLIALVAFLVPVFAGVFKEFHGELPAITKFTVSLSSILTHQWYLLIGVTAAAVVGFGKWRKSTWGRPQWDRIRMRIPFKIGDVVQKVSIARWARTLSALVSAGVPILQAVEITGKAAGNTVIEKSMADVYASVKGGGTIAAPLKNAPVFPAMVTHMVGIGEETGALDTMLSKVADFYDDEVDAAIKGLTALLEPLMIVLIGGIVGFIVVSMYMPLFKVYDSIK